MAKKATPTRAQLEKKFIAELQDQLEQIFSEMRPKTQKWLLGGDQEHFVDFMVTFLTEFKVSRFPSGSSIQQKETIYIWEQKPTIHSALRNALDNLYRTTHEAKTESK